MVMPLPQVVFGTVSFPIICSISYFSSLRRYCITSFSLTSVNICTEISYRQPVANTMVKGFRHKMIVYEALPCYFEALMWGSGMSMA